MKFLNETGLAYFLNKLKSLFVTKTDFDKVYNSDGIINAKQVLNKNANDKENLIIGNKPYSGYESMGQYIEFCPSSHSNNIDIISTSSNGNSTINLAADNSLYITVDVTSTMVHYYIDGITTTTAGYYNVDCDSYELSPGSYTVSINNDNGINISKAGENIISYNNDTINLDKPVQLKSNGENLNAVYLNYLDNNTLTDILVKLMYNVDMMLLLAGKDKVFK